MEQVTNCSVLRLMLVSNNKMLLIIVPNWVAFLKAKSKTSGPCLFVYLLILAVWILAWKILDAMQTKCMSLNMPVVKSIKRKVHTWYHTF